MCWLRAAKYPPVQIFIAFSNKAAPKGRKRTKLDLYTSVCILPSLLIDLKSLRNCIQALIKNVIKKSVAV